jgi:membrane protease YdiL (CAAX protease family)
VSTPIEFAPREPRARQHLPLHYGLAAVFAAFLLAQLLGALAGNIANSVSHAPAAQGGGPSVARVIPPMLASEFALILVSLVTPLIAGMSLRESLDLRPHRTHVFLAAAVGTVMLGPFGDRLMTVLTRYFPSWTLGVVPTLHELASHLPLLALWPTFALVPGVAEELLFRGVLQGALGRTLIGSMIAGTAFALFHVDPVHIVGVLPLGLFLSWVAYRSSTLVSIFAHVANNSLAVFTIHSAMLDVGYGTGREVPGAWVLGSLVVFAVMVAIIAQGTRSPAPSATV